jgi:hypothetical protein
VDGGEGVSASAGRLWTLLKGVVGFLPLFLASLTTLLFGVYTYFLAQEIVTIDELTKSRFQHFLSGSPNVMGDTLAGFFGSLTLIWVVASVVQQSMELRAQRREFSAMVKAQDAQVMALNEQAKIFADERSAREEVRLYELFEAILASAFEDMRGIQDRIFWEFEMTAVDGFLSRETVEIFKFPERTPYSIALIRNQFSGVIEINRRLRVYFERGKLERAPHASVTDAFLGPFLDKLVKANEISSGLAPGQKIRAEDLRLKEVITELRNLISDNSIYEQTRP